MTNAAAAAAANSPHTSTAITAQSVYISSDCNLLAAVCGLWGVMHLDSIFDFSAVYIFCLQCFCLQCFDTVGFVAGRASGLRLICGYLSGARCILAYGPADATATHCLLLQ